MTEKPTPTNKDLIHVQNKISQKLTPKDPVKILQEIGKILDELREVRDEIRGLVKELKGEIPPGE